jgi:hypothetical protein
MMFVKVKFPIISGIKDETQQKLRVEFVLKITRQL